MSDVAHRSSLIVTLVIIACRPSSGGFQPDSAATETTTSSSDTPDTTGTIGTTDVTGTTNTTVYENDDDSAGFIHGFDLLADECDIWGEDSCPRGFKCAPSGIVEDYGCSPLHPHPPAPYDPCATPWVPIGDECEQGHWCFELGFESPQCLPLCRGTPDEPECDSPCSTCLVIGFSAPVGLCSQPCDPIVQDCPLGLRCIASPGYPPLCQSAQGSALPFDSCTSPLACGPGLTCLGADRVPGCETEQCCTSLCDLLAVDPCPATDPPTQCLPWFEDDATKDACGPTLGVCASP
jgi:hypothetical protein